jgi:hypothetical protein
MTDWPLCSFHLLPGCFMRTVIRDLRVVQTGQTGNPEVRGDGHGAQMRLLDAHGDARVRHGY